MNKSIKQQTEELIAQQTTLRKEAAAVWNMAIVAECDARLNEALTFLKSLA